MNRAPTPELLTRSYADVGREPVYDPRTNELLWIDLSSGVLHRTRLDDGNDSILTVDGMLGGIVPRQQGGFAAVVEDGFAIVHENEQFELIFRELPEPNYRMYGAKCDARGRLWAGSTTVGFATGCGALHRWDGGHDRAVVREDLTLPGGIGWSPDNTFCYVLDSAAGRLFVSVFDLEAGRLGHPRLLLQFEESDGVADGLCVDAEGCLWLTFRPENSRLAYGWSSGSSLGADPYAGHSPGELRRYAQDGRHLATVPLPVSHPTGCGFGPGTTLFVTTARADLTAAQLQDEPMAGSVLAIDVGVPGVLSPPFAG